MRLQFITHCTERYNYADSACMALKGGCRWIQLRMKGASEEEWMQTGLKVGKLCRQYGAIFILNDRVDLVKALNADGVHLGLDDMPIDEARKVLGHGCIIGGTAHSLSDVLLQSARGADYIGCGPFRFTATKEKLAPVLGVEGYRQIIEGMRENNVSQPLVAIGGITADDIPSLTGVGVGCIALSGAVLQAENPIEETKRIIALLNEKAAGNADT